MATEMAVSFEWHQLFLAPIWQDEDIATATQQKTISFPRGLRICIVNSMILAADPNIHCHQSMHPAAPHN